MDARYNSDRMGKDAAIDICITSYNRDDVTIKSFEKVLHDPRVNLIHIVDDHSDTGFYKSLQIKVDRVNSDGNFSRTKVFLYRNERNLDCYRNKYTALGKAQSEFAIILDSDNVIDIDYLDAIYAHTWHPSRIMQPSFARPHFDFRELSGARLHAFNIANTLDQYKSAETMLNAMNYFVHASMYREVFDDATDPVTSDSLYMNCRWIELGGEIFVVPGMEYDHPISKDSHYKHNVKRTPSGFHESIVKRLKSLR